MSQRVSSIVITSSLGTSQLLGPGQSCNLTATVATAGSGGAISTAVVWDGATATGSNTATFTSAGGGGGTYTIRATTVWSSSTVVDIAHTTYMYSYVNNLGHTINVTAWTGFSTVTLISGDDFSAWVTGTFLVVNGQSWKITDVASSTAATIQAVLDLTGYTVSLAPLSATITMVPIQVQLGITAPGAQNPECPVAWVGNTWYGNQVQLQATVLGTDNTAVTWSSDYGTVSSSGLYSAPLTLPYSPSPGQSVVARVTAVSQSDVTKSALIFVYLRSTS